ncbi:cysteine-rich RLK (receptor-like kinase) protein, putative [Medicago truncatula]|uniref:Cysteine-rich RLK (Receptor-like kinase) protein, putative n=1 Tax=Medicago truncatula TaxID=3880 RepID=A0A072UW11_MEDTR|nr:cysteine-rich RLK (receptor-like kinase) protein, putative [Medicago truncatula]
MDATVKLGTLDNGTLVDKGRYQRLVGKLIYLSHTRPDISFVVCTMSQFMNSPTEEHMDAIYRIVKYLEMTPGLSTDTNWAGYCTFIWGNLVTWRSKKQPVVSHSSAEAEFRALSQVINSVPIKVLSDNQSTINIAKNPVNHDKTKHVEIDRHFNKENVRMGLYITSIYTFKSTDCRHSHQSNAKENI